MANRLVSERVHLVLAVILIGVVDRMTQNQSIPTMRTRRVQSRSQLQHEPVRDPGEGERDSGPIPNRLRGEPV